MKKFEGSPKEPESGDESPLVWDFNYRIELQKQLMQREGIETDPGHATAEDDQKALEWGNLHADDFREITDGDLELREQLTSADEAVREQALTDLRNRLEEEAKKRLVGSA